MSGEFTADVYGMFNSSEVMGDTVRSAKRLVTDWEEESKYYEGWTGERHVGDEYAEEVGPQYDYEVDQVWRTLNVIGPGFLNVVELVKQQARDIHRPQLEAVDDIHDSGYDSGYEGDGRR